MKNKVFTTPSETAFTTPSEICFTTPSENNFTEIYKSRVYVSKFYLLLHKRNNRGVFEKNTSVRFSDIGSSGAVVRFSSHGEFEKKAVAAM